MRTKPCSCRPSSTAPTATRARTRLKQAAGKVCSWARAKKPRSARRPRVSASSHSPASRAKDAKLASARIPAQPFPRQRERLGGGTIQLAGQDPVASHLREVGLELEHARAQAGEGLAGGRGPRFAAALVERPTQPRLRITAGVDQRESTPQPRHGAAPVGPVLALRWLFGRPRLGLDASATRLTEIDERTPAQPQRPITVGAARTGEQPLERGDGIARAPELLERPDALEALGRRRRAGHGDRLDQPQRPLGLALADQLSQRPQPESGPDPNDAARLEPLDQIAAQLLTGRERAGLDGLAVVGVERERESDRAALPTQLLERRSGQGPERVVERDASRRDGAGQRSLGRLALSLRVPRQAPMLVEHPSSGLRVEPRLAVGQDQRGLDRRAVGVVAARSRVGLDRAHDHRRPAIGGFVDRRGPALDVGQVGIFDDLEQAGLDLGHRPAHDLDHRDRRVIAEQASERGRPWQDQAVVPELRARAQDRGLELDGP